MAEAASQTRGQGAADRPLVGAAGAAAECAADARRRGHYIPLRRREIVRALVAEPWPAGIDAEALARLAHRLSLLFHLQFHASRETLKDLYSRFNPDQPGQGALPVDAEALEELFEALSATLEAGNFRRLPEADILTARDSAGRVGARVRVPHEAFDKVRFYARGWHRRPIEVRRWFGLKRETVEAEVYSEVVLAAAIAREAPERLLRGSRLRRGGVYLKLFRDIPRADLQTLYPNARVVMGVVDQLVIAVPAVVGGVPILVNLGPALGVLLLVLGGWLGVSGAVEGDAMKQALGALSALGALAGFIGRQWVKYERQKLKYQKQVSDNAYFNNLGNNAAFFDMAVGQSEEAETKEAILGYALLAGTGEAMDEATLDARVEAWLRTRFGVEVDFDVADAVAKLERLGIVRRAADGRLAALPLERAKEEVAGAWERLAEAAFAGTPEGLDPADP